MTYSRLWWTWKWQGEDLKLYSIPKPGLSHLDHNAYLKSKRTRIFYLENQFACFWVSLVLDIAFLTVEIWMCKLTRNIAEHMEKPEPSYIANRSAKCCSHFGKQSKVKGTLWIDCSARYILNRNKNMHTNMYINVIATLFIIAKRQKQSRCPSVV